MHEGWVPESPGSTQPLTRPASPQRELPAPCSGASSGRRFPPGAWTMGRATLGSSRLLLVYFTIMTLSQYLSITKATAQISQPLAPIQPHTMGPRAGGGTRKMSQPSPTPPPPGKTVTQKTDPGLSNGVIVLRAPTIQRFSHEQSS